MTHDKEKLDKLLDTIRRLKAKADDPGTTEAESMAFAAKVAELLAKHGLEEAQLAVEDQEQMGHLEERMKSWDASPARRTLAWAVCRLYMVYAIRRPHVKTWALVGRRHNIIMCQDMMDYLVKTVIRLSTQYGKANPGANVIDFRRGCFVRVAERLEELRRQQTSAAVQWTPTGNPGNLPALYRSELDLAKSYASTRWTIRNTNTRIKQGWDALAGRKAGDSISLNRQVGGGRSSHLLTHKR
jgi:Protein of unknown function (DUF2786)